MSNTNSFSALRDDDATERQTNGAEYSLDNQDRPACDTRFVSMPKITRVSMVPGELDRHPLRRACRRILAQVGRVFRTKKTTDRVAAQGSPVAEISVTRAAWRGAARRRRLFLASLVLGQTGVACWSLARTFPEPALSGLELLIVGNFAVLFSWLSFSFWSTVMGFATLWRNSPVHSIIDALDDNPEQPLRTRTAVLMPICNEDVARCFSGIEAIYRSLAGTGEIDDFDFYILSDTGEAERQVEEELAWAKTCRSLNAFGRMFYRHRRNNIKRKSGNVADFLRRWGRSYDYMIVLDADSIMSGEILCAWRGQWITIRKSASFKRRRPSSTASLCLREFSNSRVAVMGHCSARVCITGNWAKVITGDTMRSCGWRRSSNTVGCRACPAKRRWAAKFLAMISRSGVDGSGRLGSMARLRFARHLRRIAADFTGRT